MNDRDVPRGQAHRLHDTLSPESFPGVNALVRNLPNRGARCLVSSQEVETNSAFASGIGKGGGRRTLSNTKVRNASGSTWKSGPVAQARRTATGPWAGVRPKAWLAAHDWAKTTVSLKKISDAWNCQPCCPFTGIGTVCQGRAFASAELPPKKDG